MAHKLLICHSDSKISFFIVIILFLAQCSLYFIKNMLCKLSVVKNTFPYFFVIDFSQKLNINLNILISGDRFFKFSSKSASIGFPHDIIFGLHLRFQIPMIEVSNNSWNRCCSRYSYYLSLFTKSQKDFFRCHLKRIHHDFRLHIMRIIIFKRIITEPVFIKRQIKIRIFYIALRLVRRNKNL